MTLQLSNRLITGPILAVTWIIQQREAGRYLHFDAEALRREMHRVVGEIAWRANGTS